MRRYTKALNISLLFALLASPSFAFDLGSALSDAVNKQINKATNKAQARLEQNISRTLTKSFPKLAKYARLDDGQPVDLSKGIYVFGYQGCPPSRRTFAYMKNNHIKYTMMDVEKDKKAARIAREQRLPGVPAVYINGRKIIGYQPAVFDSLLKKQKK